VVAVLALAVGLVVWLNWPRQLPEPPLPDLSGVDAEVVEVIQEARQEVLRAPSAADAWGQFGEVLLAHEFNQEANHCFRQAELLDAREPAWPYLQAINLVSHDPTTGIRCLQRAVQRCEEGVVGPRLFLAEVLLEGGRLDEAQSHLEQVLKADPDDLRAQLGLGRLALLRQRWRAALTRLEACRADEHTRKRAHSWRAEAWSQLGETERARVEQQRAAELPPDRPWADPFQERVQTLRRGLRSRFAAVNHLVQAGRIGEAIEMLNQILEKYPNSVECWMRLGEVWHRLKKVDRALACFEQSVRLAPDLAEAWFRLGCMQYLAQRPEAAASFRKAIGLKPNHAQAHYNLGQCLSGNGDRKGAATEFREALRCRPDYDLARTALRDLESQAGKSR
jgi:tetratricopeptide (TPR) repeat protein